MKRFLFLLGICGCLFAAQAQTMTDANGDKVYRGNIAVIVQENKYVFDNGSPNHDVKSPTKVNAETATYAWVAQLLQNEKFRIVNRDDKAFKDVQRLLNESKSEDYLDGLSIQAKAQGADWLLLVDMTTLVEDNKYITFNYSYRLISVENNIGDHAQTEYKFMWGGEDNFRQEFANSIHSNTIFFLNFMHRFFPVQFAIVGLKGNNVKLAAYQPICLTPTVEEKAYIYRYNNEKAFYQGRDEDFNVLNLLAIGRDFSLDGGYVMVKTDNAVKNMDNTFVSLSDKNTLALEQRFFTTVIDLPYNIKTRDGYLKKRINQALYCAIGQLPQLGLIESDLLPKLKEERELQKSEEFMDGHTVEQFKAVGASYLIRISNFKVDERESNVVSFTLSFLDIASNVVVKTCEIKSHTSNLDKAVKYHLSQIFTFPCAVGRIDNKNAVLYSKVPIRANIGDSFILTFIKTTTSPTGTPISQRVELATLRYAEYQGMKHLFTIDEIKSKEDMKNIAQYLNTTNFFLLSNDSMPDLLKDNSKILNQESAKKSLKENAKEQERQRKEAEQQQRKEQRKKEGGFFGRLANAVQYREIKK